MWLLILRSLTNGNFKTERKIPLTKRKVQFLAENERINEKLVLNDYRFSIPKLKGLLTVFFYFTLNSHFVVIKDVFFTLLRE